MKTVSSQTCPICNTVHRARKCPPPRSYGAAHHQGMMMSAALRNALADSVAVLIEFAGGSAARVAEQIGTPEWRVRQLAAAAIDPTLGEIARVAILRGNGTLEAFLHELLGDLIAHDSGVHRASA